MTIKQTTAQAISRVLKSNGYLPSSAGDSAKRWPGLLCRKSVDEVCIRVWQHPELEQPTGEDLELADGIVALLTAQGYKIRRTTGTHYIYVQGKETEA
jgi:hypothetical protein